MKPEFVFVHSYSSQNRNWQQVMLGSEESPGRLLTALKIARNFDVPVIANDSFDEKNIRLFEESGVHNLNTAKRTTDEVESAIKYSKEGFVLFVTSPDHLPRVVRDTLAAGATNAFFHSSDVPFSAEGAAGVIISEPGSPDMQNRLPNSFGNTLNSPVSKSKGT